MLVIIVGLQVTPLHRVVYLSKERMSMTFSLFWDIFIFLVRMEDIYGITKYRYKNKAEKK